MLKLIPLILSLTLISAGGVAISEQNSSNNQASMNLQSRTYANNNTDSDFKDSLDLFLRANTNPSL